MDFITKPKTQVIGNGYPTSIHKPFTYKPVRERVGSDTFDYTKNAPERFFHSKQQPINKYHEMFFGPPQQRMDTGYTSNWQSLNEWPLAYLERNLTKSSRIIWTFAKWQQMESWVETIAPLQLDNSMSFTVQTKVYTDDLAEFIGLSAPVSEVAIAVSEKTQNVSYIGKGTSIHVNMMSSEEGVRELTEKLMLVANTINKTELWDFIYTLRRQRYAGIEAKKMKIWGREDKYFNQEKQEWDCVRKKKFGLENILEDVSRVADVYEGQLNHIISAEPVFGKTIFKPEYTDYYQKGDKNYGLYNQHDRNVSGSPMNPFDKIKAPILSIKGFAVHKLRRLVTTSHDIYQDVLTRYKQIGEHGLLYNRRDESFSRPEKFKKEHLEFQKYDEDEDKFAIITFEDCIRNSLVFNEDGHVREFDNSGTSSDAKFDPFMKMNGDVLQPISLIGEMNVKEIYSKDWEKKLAYVAATMNSHLVNGLKPITKSEMERYERMFTYLEKIPYDHKYAQELSDYNYIAEILNEKANNMSVYTEVKRGTADLPYVLKQQPDSGFYKLPPGKLPFGAANHWGVEAISRMDKNDLSSDVEKMIVDVAKMWVERMNVHTTHLRKSLPDCRLINENDYRKFSLSVFNNPKPQYNLWINGINNTTNFLWLNVTPFANIPLKVDWRGTQPKGGVKKFYDSIRGNTQYFKPVVSIARTNVKASTYTGNVAVNLKIVAGHLEYEKKRNTGGTGKLIERIKETGYIQTEYIDDANLAKLLATDFGASNPNNNKYRTKSDLWQWFKYVENDPNALLNPWKAALPASFAFWVEVTGSGPDINTLYRNTSTIDGYLSTLRTTITSDRVKLEKFNSNVGSYRTWFGKLGSAFSIWRNSIQTAKRLSERSQNPVKTTMTMNEYLRQSIIDQNGSHVVFETEYKFRNDGTYITKHNRIKSVSSDKWYNGENLNSLSLLRRKNNLTKHTFWPFHIWFNAMLMKKIKANSTSPVDANGSLSFENLAQFGSGYGWTEESIPQFTFIDSNRNVLLNRLPVSVKHNKDIFETLNTVVLYLSDCTRGNMIGLYQNGSCPPIEYMVSGPFMEYGTYPLILCGTGCARRIRGNPLFMMGLDPVTGIMKFRYAQSSGTIVEQPRDIYVLEDSFVWNSLGGAGSLFFNPTDYIKKGKDYFDPDNSVYGNKDDGFMSLFAIELPIGASIRLPIDIDLLGHYQDLLRKEWDAKAILGRPPLYPTAYRFTTFWNLQNLTETNKMWQFEPTNTRTAMGTMIYRDEDGNFKDRIHSKSHWGEVATYEGAKAYRNGQAHSPKNVLN